MQITEPMTMFTDYLLAAITIMLAIKLFRVGRLHGQNSISFWASAYVFTAMAAIAGGTTHGFALYLGDTTQEALWKITVYAIGLASFFMLSGTILASVPTLLRNWLLGATTLKLLAYAFWMLTHNDFRYVIFDYVPAMIAVIILQVYALLSKQEESARWIITGVLVSFAAAGIQQSGLTLHEYFNHNDLYHTIQMGAVYLFYKGARKLKDR